MHALTPDQVCFIAMQGQDGETCCGGTDGTAAHVATLAVLYGGQTSLCRLLLFSALLVLASYRWVEIAMRKQSKLAWVASTAS